MGAAFYMKSPNLIEDIGINETEWESKTGDAVWTYLEDKYVQTAYNCWIASAFYVITLIFSSVTCYLNSKQVYWTMSTLNKCTESLLLTNNVYSKQVYWMMFTLNKFTE